MLRDWRDLQAAPSPGCGARLDIATFYRPVGDELTVGGELYAVFSLVAGPLGVLDRRS